MQIDSREGFTHPQPHIKKGSANDGYYLINPF